MIADRVRDLILSGDLPVGAMVPSEASLAEQHSVSRGTARSALALLANEGLIEVVPGLGRRVAGRPDRVPPATAWQEVAMDLRERLEAGEYSTSAAMPSEAALVAEFGVSRNTVRRAYRQLVEEGLVVVRQGAGAFPVSRRRAPRRRSGLDTV